MPRPARKRRPPPSQQPPQKPPPANVAGADLYAPDFVLTIGVPFTGKSADMKRRVRPEPRLIVWDPNDEHQYHGCERVRSLPELGARLATIGAGPARLAYITDDVTEFPTVCRMVRAWAEPGVPGRAPCAFLVEELGDVVPPGKAPRWWGMLGRASRHRGIKLRAVGHSPKEIDKTALRMATTWRIHTLGSVADAEYLGKEIIGCDPAAMSALPTYHYVEYTKDDIARTPRRGITEKL